MNTDTALPRLIWACVLTVVLTCSGVVVAGGMSGVQQIDILKVGPNGLVAISGIDGDWANPDACDRSEWLALSPDHPFYRELYALMLTAKTTLADAEFYLYGCIVHVNGVMVPEIKSVRLQ